LTKAPSSGIIDEKGKEMDAKVTFTKWEPTTTFDYDDDFSVVVERLGWLVWEVGEDYVLCENFSGKTIKQLQKDLDEESDERGLWWKAEAKKWTT
jgi:hypothetical protein